MSIKETKMRQNFLRKIHNGEQPSKPAHHSYFRLKLLTLEDGIYSLTPKAIHLFIDNDSVADSEAAYAAHASKQSGRYPFHS